MSSVSLSPLEANIVLQLLQRATERGIIASNELLPLGQLHTTITRQLEAQRQVETQRQQLRTVVEEKKEVSEE